MMEANRRAKSGGKSGIVVILAVLAVVVVWLFFAAICEARTITVDDNGPADFNNIQAAINDANDGDTVIVAMGNYDGPGDEEIDFGGKAITVKSTDPNDPDVVYNTILWLHGRGFYFHSAEGEDSVLAGFKMWFGYANSGGGIYCGNSSNPTITNCLIQECGATANGGGIYCYQSSPTIRNCQIYYNWADFGGGIYCYQSSPTIEDCQISYNMGDDYGGGIYCYQSSPTIEDCQIYNNWDPNYGGGIYCEEGGPLIKNCDIYYNSSELNGGGIYCYWVGANASITDCLIRNNLTYGSGGGIYSYLSCPMIRNCTFEGNIADGNYGYPVPGGGGIFCYDAGQQSISNCIFKGNSADTGGAFSSAGCDLEVDIVNCTFFGNSAASNGGAIVIAGASGSEIKVKNSIIWNNEPNGMISGPYGKCGWASVTVDSSIFQIPWETHNDFVVKNSFAADPCLADPCSGDYHLKSAAGRWDANSESWVTDASTSPGIDAGDPNWDWGRELWPHGKRINVGAYGGTAEASMSSSRIGNIANLNKDVNDVVDLCDLGLFADKWLYEEVPLTEDFDKDGIVNFVDFDIFGICGSIGPAVNPDPCDMATNVSETVQLIWTGGLYADSHDVYLGTDFNDVNCAGADSNEYMGNQDVNHWDPCGLEFETTYHWRVDTVGPGCSEKGEVWTFTTMIDPNLIGRWRFNETSGDTAYDSSGNENNGTLYDGLGNGLVWEPNEGALNFDGTNNLSRVAIPTTGMTTTAGTISIWANLAEPQEREGGRNGQGYFFGCDNGGINKILIYMSNSDTQLDVKIGNHLEGNITTLSTQTLYHISLTWNGGTYAVYVNGAPLDSGTYAGLSSLPSTADIGNNGDSHTQSLHGLVEEVLIYDGALSGSEVQQLYQAGPN